MPVSKGGGLSQVDDRPLLLDLFCCEGVASSGYVSAGFRVMGVDLNPEHLARYPYDGVCGDAFAVGERLVREYPVRAVHMSPPCQGYASGTGTGSDAYPRLIGECREFGEASGLPYVIENVEPAKREMRDPVMLCGSMFGLASGEGERRWTLRRHRLFESTVEIPRPVDACRGIPTAQITGHLYSGRQENYREARKDWRRKFSVGEAREVMGAPWTSVRGITEAIPAAYTAHVGAALLAEVEGRSLVEGSGRSGDDEGLQDRKSVV